MENNKSSIALRVVISILAAIAIWLYVDIGQATTVKTEVHDIPVEFSGENGVLAGRNLMLLSGYDTTIDLWLEGPRSMLMKMDKNQIRIVADTSGITETGVQSLSYNVYYPDNISRNSITVLRASAYSVTVTVGELSTKEIPIECSIVGAVARGYFSESVRLDPSVLVLRGQRDDLINVSYAKVELNVSGAETDMVQNLTYKLYDYNDIEIDNEDIRTEVKTVQVTLPIKTTKTVPLVINFEEAPGSTTATMMCTLAPVSSVVLTGARDTLADIDSIVLDTIYLQDLEPYQSFEYTLSTPEGVTLPPDIKKVTATIVVSGVSERTVTVSEFRFINVPEGYTATAVTESLDILIRGLEKTVEQITPEDLVITASLTDITREGNYTVPVQVDLPNHPDAGAKGKYQIILNLSVTPEPEPEPEPDNNEESGENTEPEENTEG
jgi:YbbR domain-containing protein